LVTGTALVTLRCAPDLLWRAIENVVRNAIKHSPDGGTVTIRLDAEHDQVRIGVCDRGPGVRRTNWRRFSSRSSVRIRRRTISMAMASGWRSRSA
jgi:signal transduction histidine kinase